MPEEKPRFDNHLKKHVVRINKNIYISMSDPYFQEKMERYGGRTFSTANTRKVETPSIQTELAIDSPKNRTSGKGTTVVLLSLLLLSLFSMFLLLFGTNPSKAVELSEPIKSEAIVTADFNPVPPLQFVGANFVRTAIQSYVSDVGYPPETIEELTRDYPSNYVSFIPVEQWSGSNEVFPFFNGNGGWVYDKYASEPEMMFYPNTPLFSDSSLYESLPFQPITLHISKQDKRLWLSAGPYALMAYEVGIGHDNLTPEGYFAVGERVVNPEGKKPGVYGSAGLGFGLYAIHGTNDSSSIGQAKSLGCIRMENHDITELFRFVPKGTVINIDEKQQKAEALISPNGLLPKMIPLKDESGQNKRFHWLG